MHTPLDECMNMKYAIPLKTIDPVVHHTLMVSETSYEVVRAETHFSGCVDDGILEILEKSHVEAPFRGKAPDWHGRIDTVPVEETIREANAWFFTHANCGYEEKRRLVPISGRPVTGPIFVSGNMETLKSLVRGLIEWHQSTVNNEDESQVSVVTIMSPDIADGESKIHVEDKYVGSEVLRMLVQIALRENRFYGTTWNRDEKSKSPGYETAWKRAGLTVKIEAETNREQAKVLGNQAVEWAISRGVVLPSKAELMREHDA